MKFKFIDLFAGIGAFRIAMESIGGTCVFSSEWDKFSQKTYEKNFGEKPSGDITKINAADIPNFDVLCAGFPCQPFSSIGKREGFEHPTQGTLFYDVVRIIRHHKPKAFILENVEGLVTHEKGRTLQTILETLSVSVNGVQNLFSDEQSLGYHVHYKILDASDFGVPQTRKRIFIVGLDSRRFGPEFRFPESKGRENAVGKYIQTGVTGYSISEHLQKVYLFKKDDGRPQLVTPDSDFPVKTLVASYHKIQRLTGTFVRDSESETGIRLLSQSECKAIMGFPQSFEFPVSRTQMYRQLGNSIAVPVAREVAKCLLTSFQKEGEYADFITTFLRGEYLLFTQMIVKKHCSQKTYEVYDDVLNVEPVFRQVFESIPLSIERVSKSRVVVQLDVFRVEIVFQCHIPSQHDRTQPQTSVYTNACGVAVPFQLKSAQDSLLQVKAYFHKLID